MNWFAMDDCEKVLAIALVLSLLNLLAVIGTT